MNVIDICIPKGKYLETVNLLDALASFYGDGFEVDEVMRVRTESAALAAKIRLLFEPPAVEIETPEDGGKTPAMAEAAPAGIEEADGEAAESVEARPARRCNVCGETFVPLHRKSKYCSRRCENAFYRQKYKAQKEAAEAQETDGGNTAEVGEVVVSAAEADSGQAYKFMVMGTDLQANDLSYAIRHGKVAEGAVIRRRDGQMYHYTGGKLRRFQTPAMA